MSKRDTIKNKLIDLISRTFCISKDVLQTHNNSLLSAELGLNAIALTYLFFLVQNEFDFVFSKQILDRNRFDSVENITDLILAELAHNKKVYILSP